jgi:eukaryotic-like serine/threonine-protein kinase
MSRDDAKPLAEELVGRMAAYDEALARGDAAPGLTPLPPALEARWPRLQSCLHLLHQVGPGLGVYAAGDPAAEWYPGGPPRSFGRFVLRRELGRGGFGIVFLADDPRLRRPVALKVPRPDVLINADLRQRFLREARAAAKLDHPHVVPVHEVGNVGPISYIVCAYCPGDNLAVWLRRQPGPVPPPAAAALVATLAAAVEHAHGHGVFHRDLKPSNILLVPRPEASGAAADDLPGFIAKVTDFGLAKLLEAESDQTTNGVILGTPVYMAPEQAEGWSDAVGAPTDVYALGVILYELLTRRLPCQGASLLLTLEQVRSGQPVPPRHWQPGVGRDLETICLKCLAKEPGQRYATAANLAEDLERFLREEPIAARPAGLLARARSWCRRPERIRDAALVAVFNGFIRTVGNGMGLLLALCGAFAVARWGPALAFFLGDFILGCVVLYISWHTAAHHRRTLWAGLIVPLVWPPILIAGVAGHLDMGGLSNDTDPSAEMAQAAFILLRDVAMFVSYALALVAYYANRHRPGFVPASPASGSVNHPEKGE